jgi:hypothetical protein
LCSWYLAQCLTAPGAFAKSDWVDDPNDKSQTRSQTIGQPPANNSNNGSSQVNPGSADGVSDNQNQTSSDKTQTNGEPLQARITRFDQANPDSAKQVSPEQNLMPQSGMPAFPAWAPVTLPQSARISSETYRRWLNSTHPLAGSLTAKDKGKIIELQGSWDDGSHALRTLGLPYTRISSNELSSKPLNQVRVIVVDCGCQLSPGVENIIRQYVYGGGYLITTDWALDSCLSQCFPGYLEPNGNYSEASVVDALVVNADPRFVKGVVSPSSWKLEKRSQFVRQVGPNVEVLARSRSVYRQDPYGQGILAATFQYGRGHVLHIIGHFDTNSTGAFTNELVDPSPGIVISLRQALAANFIMAALGESAQGEAAQAEESAARK